VPTKTAEAIRRRYAALEVPDDALPMANMHDYNSIYTCAAHLPRHTTAGLCCDLQMDVQNIENNKVRLPPFSSSAEPSPQPVGWALAHWRSAWSQSCTRPGSWCRKQVLQALHCSTHGAQRAPGAVRRSALAPRLRTLPPGVQVAVKAAAKRGGGSSGGEERRKGVPWTEVRVSAAQSRRHVGGVGICVGALCPAAAQPQAWPRGIGTRWAHAAGACALCGCLSAHAGSRCSLQQEVCVRAGTYMPKLQERLRTTL
jgi:hypothetical protein